MKKSNLFYTETKAMKVNPLKSKENHYFLKGEKN